MVKECKVLLRNQYVMVVEFDGKEIQMPSDHSDFMLNMKMVNILLLIN